MEEPLKYICPSCGDEVSVGSPCAGCPQPVKKLRIPVGDPDRQRRKRRVQPKRKSWESEPGSDGLDLPGSNDFDYDDFVAREFGKRPHRRIGIRWYWWLLGLTMLILMVLGVLRVIDFIS